MTTQGATPRPWRISLRRYDGLSGRPVSDFTVSHEGTFVAGFVLEQDALDAVAAVHAHDRLARMAEAGKELVKQARECLHRRMTMCDVEALQDAVNAYEEASRE